MVWVEDLYRQKYYGDRQREGDPEYRVSWSVDRIGVRQTNKQLEMVSLHFPR